MAEAATTTNPGNLFPGEGRRQLLVPTSELTVDLTA